MSDSVLNDGSLKVHFTQKENLLKMYSPSGHTKYRWVYFFIGTDLEKCNVTSLAHQWMLCSEWVPPEWESWKHHNNSQVFHHSNPWINILWREKVHVCNKYIIKIYSKSIIFNFKPLFLVKTSPLSIILLSPVKKLSCVNQERNMHRSNTVYKRKPF